MLDAGRQLVGAIRLTEHEVAGQLAGERAVLAVAGAQQDRDAGAQGACPARHLDAVHARHAPIDQQQGYVVVLGQRRQRALAVGVLDHVVAEAAQGRGGHNPDFLVVVDQQDLLARCAARGLGAGGARDRCRRGGRGAREMQHDGRPLAQPAVDARAAAELLGDAVDHAEAEPAALADLLGGEERLEGACRRPTAGRSRRPRARDRRRRRG